MAIKPLGKRVLIKKMEAEASTKSGIILSSMASETPGTAKVVAVSDEVEEVKVGDVVYISKFAGNDIKHDGEEYTIIEVSSLLAVIE